MHSQELQRRLQSYYQRQDSAIQIGEPERLLGGYDTDVFKFAITDNKGTHLRVLRRYPSHQPDEKPTYETIAQNGIRDRGFPVPRVFEVCLDKSVMGGAFIVMDFCPGHQLLEAPEHLQSTILGQTHARLHDLDANDVALALSKFKDNRFGFSWRLGQLERACERHPQIREAFEWVRENQPAKNRNLSLCHGDFHKLNVLCDENHRVTAVLDWSAIGITEPEFDVAQTLLIFGKQAKYLVDDFPPGDMDRVVAEYLDGYLEIRTLQTDKLEYYSIVRALMGVVLGLDGHRLWSTELINELQHDIDVQIRKR